MTFHVGQKVVCINDTFSIGWRTVRILPRAKEVYTVRDIRDWRFPDYELVECLYLAEIRNPVENWASGEVAEHPFWSARFRPVIERKTDISIFTEMLKTREFEREGTV